MWKKFDDYQEGTNFCAWAFKIARFIYMNRRKSEMTAARWLSQEATAQIEQQMELFSEQQTDYVQALQECLLKLSDHDRTLVALRYEQGKTFSTISASLKRSTGGLYNSMARIHHVLRLCIHQVLKKWETV